MKLLRKSSEIGLFRLFQSLIRGKSIKEKGVTISFPIIEPDELILMVNIDIKRHHMPCLKHFTELDLSVALPDILLIYAKIKSEKSDSIQVKFFLLELGKHEEAELENKEKRARYLFEKIGLQINLSKIFVIIAGGSHGRQPRNRRYRKIRAENLLSAIRSEC